MNRIINASFLDGITGIVGTAPAVDETVLGAPGRIVSYTVRGTAGALVNQLGHVAVIVGDLIEAFTHGFSASAYAANLVVTDAGGTVLQTVPLTRQRQGDGNPRRGLPVGMDFFYGRGIATSPGFAAIQLTAAAQAANGKLIMMKPFIDLAPPPKTQCWQVGPHNLADLNLPAWPTSLPDIESNSFQAPRTPTRRAFAADAGIPITRRTARLGRVSMKGAMILTMEQRDTLNQFFLNTPEPFWFRRPDTQELCQARWLEDGDPADSGIIRGQRRTEIGLLLEVV